MLTKSLQFKNLQFIHIRENLFTNCLQFIYKKILKFTVCSQIRALRPENKDKFEFVHNLLTKNLQFVHIREIKSLQFVHNLFTKNLQLGGC